MSIARFGCILVLLAMLASAFSAPNDIVNTQWVIFDGDRSENLFGNPLYAGAFGAPYIPNQIVSQMKFGLRHVIALTNEQKLWGWGGAGTSLMTLGFGAITAGLDLRLPRPLFADHLDASFISIAATATASFAVEKNGTIFYTGALSPVLTSAGWAPLPVANSIIAPVFGLIKCGYAHCIAQDTNGNIWGVGNNAFGQSSISSSPPNGWLNELTKITIPGVVTYNLFCTGAYHSSFYSYTAAGGYRMYGMGHCGAVSGTACVGTGGTNFGITPIDAIVGFPTDGIPSQLECGAFHSVVRTAQNSVYATGANDKGQVVPPGSILSPPSFFNVLVPVFPLRGWPNPVVVIANTTIAKDASNQLTGWGVRPALLPQLGGGGGDEANNMTVSFSRPPWLRMTVATGSASSSWKPIFGVRFSEDSACMTSRPLGVAVCVAGRWVSQRPLQLSPDRTYNSMNMAGAMTVYGDFVLNSSASLSMTFPDTDSLDDAILVVDGCAQVDGPITVTLTKDNINTIRKKKKGKVSVKLIQSNCVMLAKRNVEVVLEHFLSPDDGYSESPDVPDASVEPTDSARTASSTSTVTLTPTESPSSSSSSSSCSKTSSTTEETSNSDGTTTLVAVISVDSSSCNTWWIITVSVVGGVVLIAAIAAIIIFANPTIRSKVLPYRGS